MLGILRLAQNDRTSRRGLAGFLCSNIPVRKTAKAAVITIGAALGAVAIEKIFFASPRWRGAASDHFDGERFYNRERSVQTEGSFLKWQATRVPGEWPDHLEENYGPRPPEKVGDGRLRVT